MEKEKIEQLRVKMDAMVQSKNVSKEELLRISLELDVLINERLENKMRMQ